MMSYISIISCAPNVKKYTPRKFFTLEMICLNSLLKLFQLAKRQMSFIAHGIILSYCNVFSFFLSSFIYKNKFNFDFHTLCYSCKHSFQKKKNIFPVMRHISKGKMSRCNLQFSFYVRQMDMIFTEGHDLNFDT